jgi:hypothetical protein
MTMTGAPADLEIPSAVGAAAKRASMAVDSHYLPAQLNADLRTLIEAAMCWDAYERQLDGHMRGAKPPRFIRGS